MDIVKRLKAKDEDAYEEFILKYKNLFFYMAKQVIEDNEDCEDCVQEIFLKIYNKIDQYHAPYGEFQAWIVQIARNNIIDTYRTILKRNERMVLDDGVVQKQESRGNETNMSVPLMDLKAYLTKEEYDVLIYRVVNGLTYEQIGNLIGVEKHTARRRFISVYTKARNFVKGRSYYDVKEG